MAGNQFIFAVVIAFLVFWCEAKSSSSELGYSQVYNPFEQECTWFFRANPDDCRTYFQCLHGRSVLRRCPRALQWNPEGHRCDYQTRSKCKPGKTNPGIKNSILEVHNPIKAYLTRKIIRECPPYTYQPYPGECGKFMQCMEGSYHVYDCPTGLYWDNTHKVCNWPNMVSCSQTDTSGSSSGSSSSSSSGSSGSAVAAAPQSQVVTMTTTAAPIIITSSTLAPFFPDLTTTTSVTTQRPTQTTEVTMVPSTMPTGRPTTTESSPTKYPILIPENKSDHIVVCYFTNWSVYRPDHGKFTPAEIDSSKCTHIIYAFACLSAKTFQLEPCDPWIDTSEGKNFYGLITALRKLGIKVSVAVGGWNDSGYAKWNQMLKDPQKMDIFARSVSVFLKKYNFDGIDLDYEYPVCPQTNCNIDSSFEKQAFVTLIKGLRLLCGEDAIITAAVSCNENIIKEAYDVPTMSKFLNFIHLMAYDFHGAWETKTAHSAPFIFGDDYLTSHHAINVFKNMGCPASKLVLGFPTYGQSYLLENPMKNNGIGAPVRGPGLGGPCTRQKGILAYYEICEQKWHGMVVDPQHRAGPYRYNISDGTWVSHEGPGVIREKCNYIKQEKLGGAMIWALDFDDFGNRCGEGKYPLLTYINDFLARPDNARATTYKDDVIRDYYQRNNAATRNSRDISNGTARVSIRSNSSNKRQKKGSRRN